MTARMSPAEAVMLCRFAKACCPQQQFDEYTPDAWHELLGDLRFDDCKAAVVAVTQRQPFVAPAEIRTEVRRVRYDRVDKFGHIEPPPGLEDDPRAEWDAIAAIRQRVADGELTREQHDADLRAKGILGSREVPALDGVFRRVEDLPAHPTHQPEPRATEADEESADA